MFQKHASFVGYPIQHLIYSIRVKAKLQITDTNHQTAKPTVLGRWGEKGSQHICTDDLLHPVATGAPHLLASPVLQARTCVAGLTPMPVLRGTVAEPPGSQWACHNLLPQLTPDMLGPTETSSAAGEG